MLADGAGVTTSCSAPSGSPPAGPAPTRWRWPSGRWPPAAGAGGGAAPFLYARVDLLPDGAGGSVVVEVELTEPSLYLAHGPGSAGRLADAIAGRVGGAG